MLPWPSMTRRALIIISANQCQYRFARRKTRQEQALFDMLTSFSVFSLEESSVFRNITTNDLVTNIVTSLFKVWKEGEKQAKLFIGERLHKNAEGKNNLSYHCPLKKNAASTIIDLYKNRSSKTAKVIQRSESNTNTLRRIIMVYQFGRWISTLFFDINLPCHT